MRQRTCLYLYESTSQSKRHHINPIPSARLTVSLKTALVSRPLDHIKTKPSPRIGSSCCNSRFLIPSALRKIGGRWGTRLPANDGTPMAAQKLPTITHTRRYLRAKLKNYERWYRGKSLHSVQVSCSSDRRQHEDCLSPLML